VFGDFKYKGYNKRNNMADFQAIEPLNKKKTTGWMTNLITVAVIIFVVVFALYFVGVFYENYITKNIADINSKIKDLAKEIPIEDRNEVLTFYSQLINLRALLANHLYPSNLFSRLELITHPQVTFTTFSYENKTSIIKLEGYARDLNVLAQQLLALQKTTDFVKITVSDIKNTADNVQFGVEINFNPTFIHK
jgi:hypothetical protein